MGNKNKKVRQVRNPRQKVPKSLDPNKLFLRWSILHRQKNQKPSKSLSRERMVTMFILSPTSIEHSSDCSHNVSAFSRPSSLHIKQPWILRQVPKVQKTDAGTHPAIPRAPRYSEEKVLKFN